MFESKTRKRDSLQSQRMKGAELDACRENNTSFDDRALACVVSRVSGRTDKGQRRTAFAVLSIETRTAVQV